MRLPSYNPQTNTGPGAMSVDRYRADIYGHPIFGRVVFHDDHPDIGALDAPEILAAGATRKTREKQLIVTDIAWRD